MTCVAPRNALCPPMMLCFGAVLCIYSQVHGGGVRAVLEQPRFKELVARLDREHRKQKPFAKTALTFGWG